jgi:EmrB/QacA subfamily drug resistance transporter
MSNRWVFICSSLGAWRLGAKKETIGAPTLARAASAGNPLVKPRPCDEGTIRATRVASCAERQKTWVLAAAVLASTIAYVDESVVNVALPTMQRDLDTSLAPMQWVVNAYILCLSSLVLIGGAAADRFGRRRLFLIGLAIFALASIGCGFAPNVATLIGARAFQGVGAALLIPCSLALIGAAFEEKERGAAIGLWSGFSAIAAGLGPLLGGWLVDHWSWRVIFLINPVLALPTIWIVLRHVPESRDADSAEALDWLGAPLVFLGLGSFVYGLIAASELGWRNVVVETTLVAGVLLLALFIVRERLAAAPMMPLGLFRSRSFAGVNILTLLLYGALGGALFFLPFLVTSGFGQSATAAGALFLPFTIVLGVLSRWSGRLIDRFGARWPLIIGPVICAGAFALLANASCRGQYSALFAPITLLGFGMAVTVAPLTTAVINAVPARQTGVASGISNALASVASLLAIAVFGTLAAADYDRSLDRHLAADNVTREERAAIESLRGTFAAAPKPKQGADAVAGEVRAVIREALTTAIGRVVFIAAALALLSALCAALTISAAENDERRKRRSKS